MPGFDGTGPVGNGPRTGRGRGICKGRGGNLLRKNNRFLSLLSYAVPAVTAVISDARKQNGITRKLYSAIKGRITGTSDEKDLPVSPVRYIGDEDKNG